MALAKKFQTLLNRSPEKLDLKDLVYGLKHVRTYIDRKVEDYDDTIERLQLTKALQGAVTLEFSTIPPYLCGLWSIKDELSPVAKSMREVVQEEMLHMALVCNMLVSQGKTPVIANMAPDYPGPLPLGVHPELDVQLCGLSKASLAVFLEIESPDHANEHLSDAARQALDEANPHHAHHRDETIGEFYDRILRTFQASSPGFHSTNQITGPLAWRLIRSLEDVEYAIEVIKVQGEGSSAPPNIGDLSHYYRFAEMIVGRELQLDKDTG